MGAKYRVGSITPVTFFAVLSIFFHLFVRIFNGAHDITENNVCI